MKNIGTTAKLPLPNAPLARCRVSPVHIPTGRRGAKGDPNLQEREAEEKLQLWTEMSPPGSETPTIPFCCNSELDVVKLHRSQSPWDSSYPHLRFASHGRTMLHSALHLPPCPERPAAQISCPETPGWPPMHLCNIRCSRYPQTPASFSKVLG